MSATDLKHGFSLTSFAQLSSESCAFRFDFGGISLRQRERSFCLPIVVPTKLRAALSRLSLVLPVCRGIKCGDLVCMHTLADRVFFIFPSLDSTMHASQLELLAS